MNCKNVDVKKDATVFDAKRMYTCIVVDTINAVTAEILYFSQFRSFAEFFSFVTFPLRSGKGDFYTNNICKSTVN